MDRRQFLVGCGAGAALLAGSKLQSLAFGNPQTSSAEQPIFVLLFLRGGFDGLGMIAPVNDPHYIDSRAIGLRVTDQGDNTGIELQNAYTGWDFRIHKNASALKEIYDSNQLAIIHASGLTNGTRSHFDAQDLIDKGIVQKSNTAQGWLTRLLANLNLTEDIPAISSNDNLSLAYLGSNRAISLREPKDFNLPGDAARFLSLLKSMYTEDNLLGQTAQKTITAVKYIQGKLPKDANGKVTDYLPEHGAVYPKDWYIQELSRSLANVAQLIKADAGLQIATIDFGGWDTHENQQYTFNPRVEGLSKALLAFYNDLSNYHPRLTILVMSEFGRRLKGNKSLGTDHGYGNAMLVMGGGVKGGRMYGKWPGLATEQLDNGVDLAVTTDYRNVLSEILKKQFNISNIESVFPGFKNYQPLGFL